jgi:hypothetical protein
MSGPFLQKAKKKVEDSLKNHKEQWALTGCSLMTDAWTDKRPVRLDLSAESAAIQQCFSLTTNQRTVLSA